MKEKRKNLDMAELKSISQNIKEANEGAYRQCVQDQADKIRKRLGEGKFKTDAKGKLHVGFWFDLYYDNDSVNNAVEANLEADFTNVEHGLYWFGTKWVITP